MGFACFICREPFDETGLVRDSRGSGDEPQECLVSATKCGHLFHSTCLRQEFMKSGGNHNAWIPKPCPVCREELASSDVIRVRAAAAPLFDPLAAQRPAIEELMREKNHFYQECNKLNVRLKISNEKCEEYQVQIETLTRENEEMQNRFEKMIQVFQINQEEADRQKTENSQLKDIIVQLSGKLTGNSLNEYNGRGIGTGTLFYPPNAMRMEYSDERDNRIFVEPYYSFNNMAPIISPNHHPPGLTLPLHKLEFNSSERLDSMSANMDMFKLDKCGGAVAYSLVPKTQQSAEKTANSSRLFPNSEIQRRQEDFENNNQAFQMALTAQETMGLIKENASTNLTKAAANRSSKESKVANATSGIEDCDEESLDNEWHEKKGRRRTSNESSNRSKRDSHSHHGDKKLLYGLFDCNKCGAKWGSSQSILDKPQTCRYCKTEVHPHSQGPILSRRELDMAKKTTQTSKGGKKK